MTESDMNNKVWPAELYKFRGSGGMATYEHLKNDVYIDKSCQDHIHCQIRVKRVDEHYEFVEAVNESAKRFIDFHMPYENTPVPHIYRNKDMVLKSVLEWQIDNSQHKIEKYTKELAETEEKLKKMHRKKLRPQTIDNLDFDDEIIILSSLLRLKDYQKRHITHKVSSKNGVEYLLAGNEFEVRNKDSKDFLDVRCCYYDDDYERNVDKSYLGFCSMKDFENYRNNRNIDELEEDIRILKASIEQCESYIIRNQEKLKEYNL
jgi:hypothetical protein